jgi:hypothetical protein
MGRSCLTFPHRTDHRGLWYRDDVSLELLEVDLREALKRGGTDVPVAGLKVRLSVAVNGKLNAQDYSKRGSCGAPREQRLRCRQRTVQTLRKSSVYLPRWNASGNLIKRYNVSSISGASIRVVVRSPLLGGRSARRFELRLTTLYREIDPFVSFGDIGAPAFWL